MLKQALNSCQIRQMARQVSIQALCRRFDGIDHQLWTSANDNRFLDDASTLYFSLWKLFAAGNILERDAIRDFDIIICFGSALGFSHRESSSVLAEFWHAVGLICYSNNNMDHYFNVKVLLPSTTVRAIYHQWSGVVIWLVIGFAPCRKLWFTSASIEHP